MEIAKDTSPQVPPQHSPQRQVRLGHAVIQADDAELRRTARFTDGSVRELAMKWSEVTRVAAFRRDVLTEAVVSVAVTDKTNVVVLDEHMDGWNTLVEKLPRQLGLSPAMGSWRDQAARDPLSSCWTVLYRSAQ